MKTIDRTEGTTAQQIGTQIRTGKVGTGIHAQKATKKMLNDGQMINTLKWDEMLAVLEIEKVSVTTKL